MFSKLGYSSHAYMLNITVAFCMLTCILNICCIIYYIEKIKEVENLKDSVLKLSTVQIPDVTINRNNKPQAWDYRNAGEITEQYVGDTLKVPGWVQGIEKPREKRDTSQDKKRARRRRRRKNKGKNKKKSITENKKKNITENKLKTAAAQFVGRQGIQPAEYDFVNFTKPSPWVNDTSSPVSNNGSYFTIRSDGLHLVYSQILFPGNDLEKEAGIVHSRNGTIVESFRCVTGTFDRIARMQTCTIIGMIQSQAGDMLRVQNFNPFAKVGVLKHSVYFGVVRLP